MSTDPSQRQPANIDTHARAIEEALSREYRRVLVALPNVRGTGVGFREVSGARLDEVAIVCYVSRKVPLDELEPAERVPDYIIVNGEYVPTDVRLAGDFRTDAGSWVREDRVRPVIGGLEVSTPRSNVVGSISGLFRTRSGLPRMLMSRHVISESAGDPVGTVVQQPNEGKRIGEVVDTHALHVDSGTRINTLDTALIRPDDIDASSGIYLGWLSASSTGRASIGDRVVVFSKERGIAAGDVITRGVFASLSMPSGNQAEFGGLVEYDVPSEPGTSGAMVGVLDPKTRELTIVGQHVGGTGGSSLMVPWVRIEREFGELEPEDAYAIGPGRGGEPAPVPEPDRETPTVTIITEDDGGEFVDGATVTVDGQTYTTDRIGEVTVELDPGTYTITAEKDGYGSDTTQITVDWGDTVTSTLTLAVIREPAEVTFRVYDADGSPLGAEITITGEGESITATTNSAGEYYRELDEGTYEITVASGGYQEETRTVSVEWNESVTVSFDLNALAEPTLVDDFNRTSIDPWTNTHPEYDVDPANHAVEIVDATWAENGKALQIVPASSAVVSSGLENFPTAGGGPNNDGAWEARIRMDEYGGSANIVRLDWALSGDDHLRWQIQDGAISVREGSNWQFNFGVSQSVGDIRILRVNEWRSNGYIDCSVHDGSGSEYDRITTTLDSGSASPESGGLRVWSNYTTGYSIDYLRLLD